MITHKTYKKANYSMVEYKFQLETTFLGPFGMDINVNKEVHRQYHIFVMFIIFGWSKSTSNILLLRPSVEQDVLGAFDPSYNERKQLK